MVALTGWDLSVSSGIFSLYLCEFSSDNPTVSHSPIMLFALTGDSKSAVGLTLNVSVCLPLCVIY